MTTRARLLSAALILSSLVLTACAPKVRIAPLPADLTECKAEPDTPALPVQDWSSIEAAKAVQFVRDTMMLDYTLALRAWGGDCQATVAGVKAWNSTIGGK